jgi:hypothetical protein
MEQTTIDINSFIEQLKMQRNVAYDQIALLLSRIQDLEKQLKDKQ